MRTTIMKLDWVRLRRKEGAEVVIRLAMVVNDLSSADFVFRSANERLGDASTSEARTGMIVYAMRMQLAHLREGVRVVTALRSVRSLSPYRRRLSPAGRRQYELIERILPGQADHGDYKQYIEVLRNRISFHYDRDVAKAAIDYLADTGSRNTTAVVERWGNLQPYSDVHQSRLVAGDTVAICAICSDAMWGIMTRPEADWERMIGEIAAWTFDRSRALYAFGREFSTLFIADCQ